MPEWTLADRLRKAREVAGLNQTELANDIDVSRRSVVNYESGTSSPKGPVVIAWALRCRVDPYWLAYGTARDETGPDDPDDLPNAKYTGIRVRRRPRRVLPMFRDLAA